MVSELYPHQNSVQREKDEYPPMWSSLGTWFLITSILLRIQISSKIISDDKKKWHEKVTPKTYNSDILMLLVERVDSVQNDNEYTSDI